MNVRPLHDRIIVQRIEEGEQKVGGIIIPDSAKEKPQQGKVIAAGQRQVERRRQARSRSTSRPATRSCSASTPGQEIKLDGEEYLIMREDEVLAVIEDGAGESKKKK